MMKYLLLFSSLLLSVATDAQSPAGKGPGNRVPLTGNGDSLTDASQRSSPDRLAGTDFRLPQSAPEINRETIIILNGRQVITPAELLQIKKEHITNSYTITDNQSKGPVKTVVMIHTE